jgi:hypothetical protein
MTTPFHSIVRCCALLPLETFTREEVYFLPFGELEAETGDGPLARKLKVTVDAETVSVLEERRARIERAAKRVFFDFEGKDAAAAFWVREFAFRARRPDSAPIPGIVARGEWTAAAGTDDGRKWKSLRVHLFAREEPGKSARIVCGSGSAPVMGSLCEEAAPLQPLSPIEAKAAGLSGNQPQPATTQHTMSVATQSRIVITQESPKASLKALGAILAKNAALPYSRETCAAKGALAREAATIFEADIADSRTILSMPMNEAIQAADFSDPSGAAGLLSGTLVLQKALPLMQYEFPALTAVTTDFSDEPGSLNQTQKTRIVLAPAVQSYDTSLDATGRPKGWSTVSPAQSVDVSITLDEYIGVPIVFGSHTLASTVRSLFNETAPQSLYALCGYFVNKLTALFTPANFNAYKATSVGGGETTSGDNTIVVASTASMYPGQEISGTGIPSGARVASITDSTHAELTQAATATNTGLTFTLGGGKVPQTYTTYAKALADFGAASLGDVRGALSANEVPARDRFALLNTSYHARLGADPTLSSFFAATRMPEIVTEGALPKVQGFQPIEAPWFPTSSNRVGFAGHRAAALIKSRLPSDLSSAVAGGVPGSMTTVTDLKTGLSVLLVQYCNLTQSYAEWRPEIIIGAAVGDRRAGLVLTSQ